MGGSQSTVQQAKFCLYQKEDFNTMMDIIIDAKNVSDQLAENIYSDVVPSVLQPFSKLTRNYFESLKYDNSKVVIVNGKSYTLCSIADDIYIYNQLKEKEYKTDDADKKEHIKLIFLKSKEILKLLLEILYKSCDGTVLQGDLKPKVLKNTSLREYYRYNPAPQILLDLQPTLPPPTSAQNQEPPK